jgi:hypothetical protein
MGRKQPGPVTSCCNHQVVSKRIATDVNLIRRPCNFPSLARAHYAPARRPAPPEQRFGCRVVDDPAVADEKASLRDRNDIAKRGHPVLQGSPTAAHRPLAAIGRAAARVDRQFAIRYQAFDSPREIRRVGGGLRSGETQR